MSKLITNTVRHTGASSDAITLASDGTCTAEITNRSNRNLVINGSMIINQRGDQAATGTSGYYACDRFKTVISCAAEVAVSKSTESPAGFASSMRWDCTTADASVAAGDWFVIRYGLEGQDLQQIQKGTASAKEVTLSFYAKATKTGTYIVELIDHDNSSRHVNKSYTVSDTDWNRYTITFPADTTGTFNNDNAKSMDINFWLQAGSTYSGGTLQTSWGADTNANRAVGQVNALDSTSNDFYLTGVQLELGSTATDFEHRWYGDELRRCQRYFYKPTRASTIAMGYNYSSLYKRAVVDFPVQMRNTPSATVTFTASSGSPTWTPTIDNERYAAYVGEALDTDWHKLNTCQFDSEL